jgi:hypothetical protein
LAIESLHDRITLDAALAGSVDDVVLEDEESEASSGDEVFTRVDHANGELLERELTVDDASILEVAISENGEESTDEEWTDGNDKTSDGEIPDGQTETEDAYDESECAYDEECAYDDSGWDDSGWWLYNESGLVYAENLATEENGGWVDPDWLQRGGGDDSVMYTFMTGDAGAEEEGDPVLDAREDEPAPQDEIVADGGFVKDLPFERFVVSAEGEYLPLSAVQRTLDGNTTPDVAAGEIGAEADLTDLVVTTGFLKALSLSESGSLLDSSHVIDVADLIHSALPDGIACILTIAPSPAAPDAAPVELAPSSGSDQLEFELPTTVEFTAASSADVLDFAPSEISTVSDIAAPNAAIAAPVANGLISGIAVDQGGVLQLAIALGVSSPHVTSSLDAPSDEWSPARSDDETLDLASLALVSPDDSEDDKLNEASLNDAEQSKGDEDALTDCDAEAADGAEDAIVVE